MRLLAIATVALASMCLASSARAASIQLTFNDLTTGGALLGQGGGAGASGNWAGAAGAVSQVISGDLTAPSSTNYSVNQGGTPLSVQSTSGSTASNVAAYRTLATPLTGTTWFSFLIDPVDSTSRIGIGINGAGSMGGATGEYRILAVGTSLFTNNSGTIASTFVTGTGNLLVGEIISPGTTEELKLWLNPNVSTFQSSTPTPTYDTGTLTGDGITTTGSISNLTPISYTSGGTTNGIIDNIVFSNDSNAESEALAGVVPEPSAFALLAMAGSGLLCHRRRPF